MDEFDSPIARTAPVSRTFEQSSVTLFQAIHGRRAFEVKVERLLAGRSHSVIPGEDPQSENDHRYEM